MKQKNQTACVNHSIAGKKQAINYALAIENSLTYYQLFILLQKGGSL